MKNKSKNLRHTTNFQDLLCNYSDEKRYIMEKIDTWMNGTEKRAQKLTHTNIVN